MNSNVKIKDDDNNNRGYMKTCMKSQYYKIKSTSHLYLCVPYLQIKPISDL